jgi:hypothetical protein
MGGSLLRLRRQRPPLEVCGICPAGSMACDTTGTIGLKRERRIVRRERLEDGVPSRIRTALMGGDTIIHLRLEERRVALMTK